MGKIFENYLRMRRYIGDLTQKGIIESVLHPKNAKKKYFGLTPKGFDLCEKFYGGLKE